jgi:RNA polymerase sigma-70 factor, ECF subfamily
VWGYRPVGLGVASLLAEKLPAHMSDWILVFISSNTLRCHLTIHVLMGVDGEDRQTAPAVVTIKRGNSSGSEKSVPGQTQPMAVTETDTLLVRHVRAGNAEAWRQLIERFEGRLLAFVDSRLRDRAASEDVVQETFVGFLTSLPHYDEKRDLEAYLFSIAAHKLTDHLRKQGRRPIDQFGSDDHGRPLEEVPGGARPASSIARSGERRDAEERLLTDAMGQLVREWLAKADFDRLRCLELLIVKGWANKDVAKYLDLTEQAVASYKFQTIGRLKDMARRSGLSLEHLGEG